MRYALIEKMSADVDEDNLARCCETAPDQCSKRYIAGALLADGNYYAATQAGSGGSADLEALRISELPIDAAIVFDNDMKWERKVGFKRQYFAFNVRRGLAGGLGNAKADDKSCDWVNNLPSSLDGKFYVGTGKPELSTQAARDTALANVKDQIIKDLGEWITETSSTTTSISAAGKEAATLLEGSQVREHMQGGVARDIEAKKWCGPNVIASPDGQYQEYQVLAFFSHKARYTASKLALKEIIRVQKAANRNTAALEEFLAAVEKDSPK